MSSASSRPLSGMVQHPFREALTPAMSSPIDTSPLPSRSKARHVPMSALPRSMWTRMISSWTPTASERSQSPAQADVGVIGVALAVVVAVAGMVGVRVALAVALAVLAADAVGVAGVVGDARREARRL